MSEGPGDIIEGNTVAEWIGMLDAELEIDGIDLRGIILDGRGDFGLNGSELVSFIRTCVVGILNVGAKPVRGGRDSGYEWIEQPQYGTTPDAIADAVMAEWIAAGVDSDLGGLWFARPDPAYPGYVKRA